MARYNWDEDDPHTISHDVKTGIDRLVWVVNVLMLLGAVAAVIGLAWVCSNW